MGVSKVVLGDETLIDLTNDTVSENTLLAGETAHNAAGEEIQGGVVVVPTYFGTKEAIEAAIAAGEIPDGSLVNITDDEEQSSFQKQINDLNNSLNNNYKIKTYTNPIQFGCNSTFLPDICVAMPSNSRLIYTLLNNEGNIATNTENKMPLTTGLLTIEKANVYVRVCAHSCNSGYSFSGGNMFICNLNQHEDNRIVHGWYKLTVTEVTS